MKAKIKTHSNAKPTKKLEISRGGSKTEQCGYIPPSIRIREMVMAGQRLAAFRKEQFDCIKGEQDIEWNKIPVTRRKGVDLVDVMSSANELEKKLEKARKDAEKKMLDAKIEARAKELAVSMINPVPTPENAPTGKLEGQK